MNNLLNYLLIAYRLKNDMTHELFSYSVLYRKSSNDLFFLLPPNSSEEYIDRFFSAIHARLGKAAIYFFLCHQFNKTPDKKAFLSLLYTQCKSRLEVIADRKARGLYLTKFDFSPRLHICLEWINEVQNSYSFSNDQLQILEQNDVEKTNGIPKTFTETNESFTGTKSYILDIKEYYFIKSNNKTSLFYNSPLYLFNNGRKAKESECISGEKEKINSNITKQNKIRNLQNIKENIDQIIKPIETNKSYKHLVLLTSILIYKLFYLKDSNNAKFYKANTFHVTLFLSLFDFLNDKKISTILSDYASLGFGSNDRGQNVRMILGNVDEEFDEALKPLINLFEKYNKNEY